MKNNILLLLLSFISISIYSQKKTEMEKKYYPSGAIKSETSFYFQGNKKINEGKSTFWYETGELKNVQMYKKGKLNGERTSYWKNGQVKRKDVFKKGKFKEGKCFDEKGNEVKYYDFEIPPKFPGGKNALIDFIKKNFIITNPNIMGSIIVKFYIEPNGTISNPKIIKDTNPSLKEETLKLIKLMPNWIPGQIDGIPIKAPMSLPISFRTKSNFQ